MSLRLADPHSETLSQIRQTKKRAILRCGSMSSESLDLECLRWVLKLQSLAITLWEVLESLGDKDWLRGWQVIGVMTLNSEAWDPDPLAICGQEVNRPLPTQSCCHELGQHLPIAAGRPQAMSTDIKSPSMLLLRGWGAAQRKVYTAWERT